MVRTHAFLGALLLGCASDHAGDRPSSGPPDDMGQVDMGQVEAADATAAQAVVPTPSTAWDAPPATDVPADSHRDGRVAMADTNEAPTDAPALVPCPASPASYTPITDVAYTTPTNRAQLLDAYVPDGPGPYPALIWIPGGGWVTGTKEKLPAAVKALAARGYVVVSLSHRPSNVARFPAQIHDVKAAIRFLRAHAARFKLDGRAVGVGGDSSGGHLSALAGTSGDVAALEDRSQGHPDVSSRVQAAAPFYGPSDFLQMNAHTRAAGCPTGSLDHDAINSPESRLIGCAIQKCPDKAREANPIVYISRDDPPFLVQHGQKDCKVPPGQSQVLHDALRAGQVPSTLFLRVDAGHSRAPYATSDFYGFLDETLRRCR